MSKVPLRNRAKSGPKQYKTGDTERRLSEHAKLEKQARMLMIRLERFGRRHHEGNESLWAGYMCGAIGKALRDAECLTAMGKAV